MVQASGHYALSSAHSALIRELDRAIEQYDYNCRFSNGQAVCGAIERFVHELHLVPDQFAELERRVHLVEAGCARHSAYMSNRRIALTSHPGAAQQLCRGKLWLDRLRKTSTVRPHFLAKVIEVRKCIEAVLEEPSLGLSVKAIEAFAAWRNLCRKIQREAERLEVDGCWFLYHIYLAAEADPSKRSLAARSIMSGDWSGGNMKMIRAAVESLVNWVSERHDSGDGQPHTIGENLRPVVHELPAAEPEYQQFTGGEIVFYEDWVAICGADICSGPRSQSSRRILDVLKIQDGNGKFIALSGDELAEKAQTKGGTSTVSGLIRDLRRRIIGALRDQANIQCGLKDVILSGGPGYRLNVCVSVRDGNALASSTEQGHPAASGSQDGTVDGTVDGPVTGTVTDTVISEKEILVPVHFDRVTARRERLLGQIKKGQKIRVPGLAAVLHCSERTVKRDINALGDQIEFVGSPGTGHYQMRVLKKSRRDVAKSS